MEVVLYCYLFLFIVVAFFVIKQYFLTVHEGKMVIIERFGKYSRTLHAGMHFLYPFDTLKSIHWSCPTQDGAMVKKSTIFINTIPTQMDVPPIKCLAKNLIRVTVDTTLIYNVTDLRKAVYLTDDPLNWLWQIIQQSVIEVVSQLDIDELRSFHKLSALIQERINEEQSNIVGFQCSRFVIQNITIDPSIVKSTEKIYSQEREHRFQIEKEHSEHERAVKKQQFESAQKLVVLNAQIDEQRVLLEKERLQKEHELSLKEMESVSEQHIKRAFIETQKIAETNKWDALKAVGFSSNDMVEMHAIDAQAALKEALLTGSANTVWAPSDILGLEKRRRLLGPILQPIE